MSKIRLFHVNKMAARFCSVNQNCIIIYNNNSGMTIKTVYIPIILLPNILWQYFDAAFLNSSIFGVWCKQWGQIDNSETGKSAIKLTEYNQPDPKESHSF